MLLRFRSKDGMHRVSCESNDTMSSVLEKLIPLLDPNADLKTLVLSDKPGDIDAKPASTVAMNTVSD